MTQRFARTAWFFTLLVGVACGGAKDAEPGGRARSGGTAGTGGAEAGAAGSATGGGAGVNGGTGGAAAGQNSAGVSASAGAGAGGVMGGSAGTSDAGGTGGIAAGGLGGGGAGSGGPSGGTAGEGAGTAGTAGSSAGSGPVWHAQTAAAVTEALLASEYATWKMRHTETCADGSAVVKKDQGSVVSEGIGYGMLLSANFDDRPLFDGLWQYYGDHDDLHGLMNWSTGVCDAAGNNNAYAATDGDLDVAMALIQAHARWPDGGYLDDAAALTAKIAESETELCGERAILRPGDNFGGCSDTANARINPSYFAPGYYRVFAAKFPEQAERWNALTTGSYELYPLYQARMSGLVPDWSAVDGGDWYGAGYSYDACRTPWRVMVDYAFSGDPAALTFLQNIRGWVSENDLGTLPNNSAFLGSFALAAAYDQAELDAAVTSWLASNGDDSPYFQGTLRVLYLLAAAGQFPSTL